MVDRLGWRWSFADRTCDAFPEPSGTTGCLPQSSHFALERARASKLCPTGFSTSRNSARTLCTLQSPYHKTCRPLPQPLPTGIPFYHVLICSFKAWILRYNFTNVFFVLPRHSMQWSFAGAIRMGALRPAFVLILLVIMVNKSEI